MQIKHFFALTISIFGFLEPVVAQETVTQEELVRRTQELFDAVVPGNPEPWKKHYAEDAIFSDEKGRSLNKTALVADITPMPTGYSGAIKIMRPQSRIFGDAAVLSYDLDETETIFGQNLKARYHETDTWLRRNGLWQIIATQAFRYYEDPAIGKADSKRFPQFAGNYELAAGQIRAVTAEGDKLFVERKGKREQLYPESCDIFFRKGVEGRILFRSGEHGKSMLLSIAGTTKMLSGRKSKTLTSMRPGFEVIALAHELSYHISRSRNVPGRRIQAALLDHPTAPFAGALSASRFGKRA